MSNNIMYGAGFNGSDSMPLYESVEEAVEMYLDYMDEDEVKQIPPETKIIVEEYGKHSFSL